MSTKHTPGPWAASGSEKTLSTWVTGPDGKRVCTIATGESDWSNAQLIAAAPELLEALQLAYLHINGGPGIQQGMAFAKMHAQLQEVIAKATGEHA